MSLDLSPLQRFLRGVAGEGAPADYAWQLGVLALAFALAWGIARLACRRLAPSPHWDVRDGGIERVAFHALAYVLVSLGHAVLSGYQRVALLEIAQSILLATLAIRIAVYVLGRVLPAGALLRAAVRTIAWVAWIAVTLHVTGLLDPTIAALDRVGFTSAGGKQRISLWLLLQGLAALGLTLTVALWAARLTETRLMASGALDVSTRLVMTKLVRVAALFVAILVALPMVGIDVTTLSIFGGALGVGLGFGLQKIASNYVSGFIVLLDRSLRLGDVITVDGRKGEVKEIATRYTVLKGGDGVESIIPNEKLISESVHHHSFSVPRIMSALTVVVTYESDAERACAILLEAARAAAVLAEPGAAARVKALRDHGIELELTVWLGNPGVPEADVRSAIYRAVLGRFREAGIAIAVARREWPSPATPETPK